MVCFRVFGDDEGETSVERLELPIRDTPAGQVRGVGEIPLTSGGIAEFVGCRKPDTGLHEAPRLAFIVVLGGALEIETSRGERAVLQPGDVLLAEDMGSKGHHSRDVGDVPLTMMTIGIGDDWDRS